LACVATTAQGQELGSGPIIRESIDPRTSSDADLSILGFAAAEDALSRVGPAFLAQATGAFGAPPNEGNVDEQFSERARYAALGPVNLPSDTFREGKGWGVWAAPFGETGEFDPDGGDRGEHDFEMAGAVVGYERAFEDGRAVGLYAAYAGLDMEWSLADTLAAAEVEGHAFGAGAFARYARGQWRARVTAGYTAMRLDMARRSDLIAIEEEDSVDANTAAAAARVAYRFEAEGPTPLVIEPYLEATFAQTDRDQFDTQFTRYDDESTLSLETGGGISASALFTIGDLNLSPRAGIGFVVETLDNEHEVVARRFFDDGTVLQLRGVTDEHTRGVMLTGFGVEAQMGEIAAVLAYAGEFSADRSVHSVNGRLGYRF
jgi:hypothetical protein